jgi:hypothetical protein
MKLPLTKEQLDDFAISGSGFTGEHKLIEQAKAAIELKEALEWLAESPWVFQINERTGKYEVQYWDVETAISEGSTPLEAIQAAMRAEKEGKL